MAGFERRRLLLGGASVGLSLLGACQKKQEGKNAVPPALEAAGSEILIGQYVAAAGWTAAFGRSVDNGVALAVQEANRRGGVRGRPLRIMRRDSGADPTVAAHAVTELIGLDEVVAVIGEVALTPSLAGAEVAQKRRVPMIAPAATSPAVTEVGNYVFRACFLDSQQGAAIATFAHEHLKIERVALVREDGNAYSNLLADAFRAKFGRLGGRIVADLSYARGQTDFGSQVASLKASEAHAICVPGYYDAVGLIARQMRSGGVSAPMLGGDGWDASDLFQIAGDALDGSDFCNHFALDIPSATTKHFVTEFQRAYGVEPNGIAALAYDAGGLLVEAIARAKAVESTAIRDALEGTRDFEGATGSISMGPGGNPLKSVFLLKIVNERAVYEAALPT